MGTYPNNLGSVLRLDLLWSNTRSVVAIAKPAVRREMMRETYISGWWSSSGVEKRAMNWMRDWGMVSVATIYTKGGC